MSSLRKVLTVKFYGNNIDSFDRALRWLKAHGFRYDRALTSYTDRGGYYQIVLMRYVDE